MGGLLREEAAASYSYQPGEGYAPEDGRDQHSRDDAARGLSERDGQHGTYNGRKDQGREEGDASEAEVLPDRYDPAVGTGEEWTGAVVLAQLCNPDFTGTLAYEGEDEDAGHHASHRDEGCLPKAETRSGTRQGAEDELEHTA